MGKMTIVPIELTFEDMRQLMKEKKTLRFSIGLFYIDLKYVSD